MIKEIHATNWKGTDIDVSLDRFNIIRGPNGSGKTGILDALFVGGLGRHPDLGARTNQTFALSSGRESVIRLYDENANAKVVKFWLEKGSAKTETTVDEITFDPIALSFSEFDDMTKGDRTSALLGMATIPGGASDLIAKIKGVTVGKKHGTEHQEALNGLVDDVNLLLEDGDGEIPSLVEMITLALEEIKATKSGADKSSKDAAGYLKTDAEISLQKAILQEATDEDATKLEIKARRDEMEERVRTEEGLRNKITNAKKIKARKSQLERAIESKDDLIKEIEKAQEIIDQAPDPEKLKELIETKAQEDEGLAKAKGDKQAKEILAAANRTNRNDAIAEAQELLDEAHCPTCKADGEAWREPYRKAFEAADRGYMEKGEILSRELSALTNQILDRVTRNDEVTKELSGLNQRDRAATSQKARIEDLRKQLASLGEFEEELKTLVSSTEDLDDIQTQIESSEGRRLKASDEIASYERKIQETRDANAIILNANDAQERKDTADALLGISKAIIKALEEWKSELLEDAIAGVLAPVNKIVEKVRSGKLLAGDVVYVKGSIGQIRAGAFVPVEVLSGTERAIIIAALKVCFAPKGQRILIVDELARLTETPRQAFLGAVQIMIQEGEIDQFIGIIPDESCELTVDVEQLDAATTA